MIAAQPAVVEALLGSPPPGTAEAAEAIGAALGREPSGRRLRVRHLRARRAGSRRAAVRRRGPPAGGARAAAVRDERRARPHARRVRRGLARRRGDPRDHPGPARGAHGGSGHRRDHPPGRRRRRPRGRARALVTPRHDDSWCHTLAYTSALAAAAALAGRLGPFAADAGAATSRLLEDAIGSTDAAPIGERLADRRVVLCAGAQADHTTTARELALKIAEGARLPHARAGARDRRPWAARRPRARRRAHPRGDHRSSRTRAHRPARRPRRTGRRRDRHARGRTALRRVRLHAARRADARRTGRRGGWPTRTRSTAGWRGCWPARARCSC